MSNETTNRADTEEVIAFTNYNKTRTNATTGQTILPLPAYGQKYDGGNYNLFRSTGSNTEGFLLNGYAYNSNSKLFLSQTPYHTSLDNASIGLHINLSGNEIKTYNSSGLSFTNSLNTTVASITNSGFSATSAGADSKTIQIGGGSVTMDSSYADANISFFVNIHITGANYEFRYVYLVNHNGYGGNAVGVLIATHYAFNNTGGAVSAPSIYFDSNARPVVTVASTDRVITVTTKRLTIGYL